MDMNIIDNDLLSIQEARILAENAAMAKRQTSWRGYTIPFSRFLLFTEMRIQQHLITIKTVNVTGLHD